MAAVRSQGINFKSERKEKTLTYSASDREEKVKEAIKLRQDGFDVKLNHKE